MVGDLIVAVGEHEYEGLLAETTAVDEVFGLDPAAAMEAEEGMVEETLTAARFEHDLDSAERPTTLRVLRREEEQRWAHAAAGGVLTSASTASAVAVEVLHLWLYRGEDGAWRVCYDEHDMSLNR